MEMKIIGSDDTPLFEVDSRRVEVNAGANRIVHSAIHVCAKKMDRTVSRVVVRKLATRGAVICCPRGSTVQRCESIGRLLLNLRNKNTRDKSRPLCLWRQLAKYCSEGI